VHRFDCKWCTAGNLAQAAAISDELDVGSTWELDIVMGKVKCVESMCVWYEELTVKCNSGAWDVVVVVELSVIRRTSGYQTWICNVGIRRMTGYQTDVYVSDMGM